MTFTTLIGNACPAGENPPGGPSVGAVMPENKVTCVLLADRHQYLSEGVRGLLATVFETVVMVADDASLLESARRLQPEAAVVDLSLRGDTGLAWLRELRAQSPTLKLIVLSVHDELDARQAALEAGADGFVLKRHIAGELLPTIEKLMRARPREQI